MQASGDVTTARGDSSLLWERACQRREFKKGHAITSAVSQADVLSHFCADPSKHIIIFSGICEAAHIKNETGTCLGCFLTVLQRFAIKRTTMFLEFRSILPAGTRGHFSALKLFAIQSVVLAHTTHRVFRMKRKPRRSTAFRLKLSFQHFCRYLVLKFLKQLIPITHSISSGNGKNRKVTYFLN